MYTNIHSISSKRLDLEYELGTYDSLPILLLTETWLHENVTNQVFPLFSRYSVFRADRMRGMGGGCAILVPHDVHAMCPPQGIYRSESFEAIFLDVYKGTKSIQFVLIYRPPNNTAGMPEEMLSYIEQASQTDKPIAVFGDFNYPSIDFEKCTASSYMGQDLFMEHMMSFGFCQLIEQPTRGDNILDLLFVSEPNLIQNVVIQPPIPGCDHNLVSALWCLKQPLLRQLYGSRVCNCFNYYTRLNQKLAHV